MKPMKPNNRNSADQDSIIHHLDDEDYAGESIGYVLRGKAKLAEAESSDISGDSDSFILRLSKRWGKSNATSCVSGLNTLAGASIRGSDVTIMNLRGDIKDRGLAVDVVNGEEVEVAPKKRNVKYTCAQWRGMFIFCLTNVGSLCCASLQGPIYPKTAGSKGASLTAAGFVFGVFQLTVFIMSLIYGSLLGRIRPRLMAITGVFVMAFGCIAFGFVIFIDDPLWFILVSFALRIIQANGNAAFVTAAFAMIASEFPDSVAKAISYMETAAGLGLIFGPAVGGLLYSIGGFILPFVLMGTILLVTGVISMFYMPVVDMASQSKSQKYEKRPSMISLLMIPSVALAALSVLAAASAIGYLLPTLEPHVFQNFNLPEAYTGIVFVIDGAMYALFSPMWGWLCDKFECPRVISLIGSSLIFGGYMLVGPAPFMPWAPILWGTCLGCVIFGFGLGATFVSGFVQALTDARNVGMPDNVETHGLVSGMWFAMLSLGVFVGASAGGFLTEHFGFQNGTYFVLASQALIGVCTILFMFVYGVRTKPISSSPPKQDLS